MVEQVQLASSTTACVEHEIGNTESPTSHLRMATFLLYVIVPLKLTECLGPEVCEGVPTLFSSNTQPLTR